MMRKVVGWGGAGGAGSADGAGGVGWLRGSGQQTQAGLVAGPAEWCWMDGTGAAECCQRCDLMSVLLGPMSWKLSDALTLV
jgi:hypothetical protein